MLNEVISQYIYDLPDIEDGLHLLINIEELVKEWKEMYPTHRYEYEMQVNADQSCSFIIKVYHVD